MTKNSVGNVSNLEPKTEYGKIDKNLIKDMTPIETIENPLRIIGGNDRRLRYTVYAINSYDSVIYHLIDEITLDIIYCSEIEEKVFKQATARILQYAQQTFKEKFFGKKVAYYTNYQDWKIGSVASIIFKRRSKAIYGYSYYEPYFKIVDEKGKKIRNYIKDCRIISEKDINQIKKLSAEYIAMDKKINKTGDKLRDLLKKPGMELRVINNS